MLLLSVVILQLCTVSVVVGVDAELEELYLVAEESSVDNVVQCEQRIVSQSRAFLSASSHAQVQSEVDELNERLRPLGLHTRLLVVERANSLALYFICMTLAALMSLRDQWRSRQLRRTVQSLFTFLSGQRVHVMRIAWPLSAYNRCLEFFSSVQGDETILLLCCCLNNFSVAVTSIHCEP